MQKEYDYIFKLLLLGDQAVGKTSLLNRFANNTFNPYYISSIGVDFKSHNVEINGQRIRLQIWDTAGQERFRAITKAYYRGAMGVMFVYDVTDESTFENIAVWMKTMEEDDTSVGIVRMIIANKSDLEEDRKISTERGQQLAESCNAIFIETSAKSNVNVEEAFLSMARAVKVKLDRAGGTWSGYHAGNIQVVNDQTEQQAKSCGCV